MTPTPIAPCGSCTACGPSRPRATTTTPRAGRRRSVPKCGAWSIWCTGTGSSRPGRGTPSAATTATCRITFWGSSSAGNGSRFRSGPTTRAGAIVPRSPVGFSRSIGAHQPMSGWPSSATTCSPTSGIPITPNGPSHTPTGPLSTRFHTRRSPRSRRSSGCVGATASRPIRGSRNTTTTANRSTRCWCTHTWVTIDLEAPAERSRLWHNMEDAEQHYGLMGEYAGASADATPQPGGDPAVWRALTVLARGDSLVLRVGADPSYLYVALAGRPSFDSARYVVGIDTYRRDRGQFRLPGVPGPTGEVGSEFALVLNDTSDAQLMVAPWYNPFLGPRSGMGSTGLDRFYNEATGVDKVRSDGAFDSLFVTTNRWRIARTGRTYPARGVNRGRLRHGRSSESTLADWYVDRAAGLVEVRIAWGLLNVTDPSSRHVMVRYRRNGTFETAVTDGFRFDVAALDRSHGGVVARLGAGQTYAWPTWEVPTWHERLKPAYQAMRDVWGSW